MGAAKDVPIDTGEVGNIALEIKDLGPRGGYVPKVVRDFVNRTTAPNQPPLTYSEARDFYSNASRLSANESGRMTDAMKYHVGRFTAALGRSIQGAADSVGQGSTYSGAMSEYAGAAANARRIEALKDFGLRKALPAAGLGASGALGYGLYKALNQ